MIFSSSMESKIRFARFAKEHNVDPVDLAELLVLAQRAFKAGVNKCNKPGDRYVKANANAQAAFEAKAKSLRFGTYWPGLLPGVIRRGERVHLPIDD